jgi:hypothetical protein
MSYFRSALFSPVVRRLLRSTTSSRSDTVCRFLSFIRSPSVALMGLQLHFNELPLNNTIKNKITVPTGLNIFQQLFIK